MTIVPGKPAIDETRSKVMASVKSCGNKSTELRFISILKVWSINGWRRHYRLSGKPDFTFPKKRIVVFIDGCFWHGCPKHCRMPASNVPYWENKIKGNVRRDNRIRNALKEKGWTVYRFWEHELKGCASLARKLRCLKNSLCV